MNSKRRAFTCTMGAAVLFAASVVTATAHASSYPEKPITMVVNFGPGGVTDLMSRALASGMEKALNQSIVVLNKPGALGTLGPTYTSQQNPDGYTIGIVSASVITTTPHLMDVGVGLDDITHVAGFGKNRYGIVVRQDSPLKSVDDLIAKAKEGESVFFGSPSTPNSLVFFDLGRQSGGKFELINYKSGPEASLALLSGQVAVIAPNPPDVMSNLQAGKLRLLASASSERWPEFPDVPTLKETGHDVSIEAWVGVAVPAGTPDAIIQKLQDSVQKAMAMPDVQESIKKIGADPEYMSGKDYTDFLVAEKDKMGVIIKEAGIPRIK